MPRKAPLAACVDVAVMAAIPKLLTYREPDGAIVLPGQRVLVPVAGRSTVAVVVERAVVPPPGVKVKPIERVLDPKPVLSANLMQLASWMADYYLAPPGEVFRAMLPVRPETRRAKFARLTDAGMRRLADLESTLLDEVRDGPEARWLRALANKGSATVESLRRNPASAGEFFSRARSEGWIEIVEEQRELKRRKILVLRLRQALPGARAGLSPAARRILEALERAREVPDHRPLLKSARASLGSLRKLERAGLVEVLESDARGRELPDPTAFAEPLPTLTAEQKGALQELTPMLESRRFAAVLLHGVTASGKTEVYLRLIARCLEQGRTALLLVPEIALTPAAEAQFAARLGGRVAILHSGLTEAARDAEWRRAKRGEARVVLGTRSAVFAPLPNLGLLIVDEEHDASYKQEETPRYHARDVAVVRAKFERALVVLGSATPSLESYANAQGGKYRLLRIEGRVGGRSLATVEIVDMRHEFRETFSQVPISRRLREQIEAELTAGAQTMILLNRRGYSWFLFCRSCGETRRCANCSISLTYHRREQRLVCHYCGYSAEVPKRCPHCGSEYLHYVGEGTEKLEDRLAEFFPGARVARLDRDVARRPGQFARVLADFRAGKIDILVGTQLIAKGHDFPGVTLVGVVSVDTGLALPDFRSAERTFQLLTQAAGRAGRGDLPGRVLVQTFYPEHYAVRLAAEQNYEGFYAKEIRFRRAMRYPPAAALANVVAQDLSLECAARVAARIGKFFEALDASSRGLRILGPSPAPLARIQGRYRIQFLLKSPSRARLIAALHELREFCRSKRIPPEAVMMDVDPVSLM